MTKSQSVATFFRKKLKLQRDDTIAIVMPNVPEYPIVIFAASFAGLKATTVNPDFNIGKLLNAPGKFTTIYYFRRNYKAVGAI